MSYRVGRTILGSAARIPGATTGSAYSAYDAYGSAFELPVINGLDGGLVAQLNAIDLSTGLPNLNLHCFSTALTVVSTDGVPWSLDLADFPNYLGFINIAATDWFSASGRMMASVKSQNIGLWSKNGSRSIWCQTQLVNTPTFGNVTGGGVWLNLVNLGD